MSQDTLSDVLRGVRLRGAVFLHVSGSSDWAVEAPPGNEIAPLLMRGVEHVIEYHAVTEGSCWAGIPGAPAVQLRAGDDDAWLANSCCRRWPSRTPAVPAPTRCSRA